MSEQYLQRIGELIRTQDNRETSDPLFIVQEKRRLYGFDTDFTEDTVWVFSAGDYEEADREEGERLQRLEDEGNPDTDWTKMGYLDQWVFVTACFTEAGCQAYIDANSHNLDEETRIYAASAYRNEEFKAVRKFLQSLL